MNDEKLRKTRLLEDLDNVRKRISELEEAEIKSAEAEKEMRNRMERFRLAVDNTHLGVFVVGVQGRFQYLNAVLLKGLGFDSLEKASKTDALSFPPFETGGIAREIRKCLEARTAVSFEGSLGKPQKSSWYRIDLTPMFDPDGSIGGVLGVLTETTNQRTHAEDLGRKLGLEKSMHTLLSGLVGVFDFDDAINRTLASLGESAEADRTHLFLLYDNDTMLDNTHEWCAEGIPSRLEPLQNLPAEKFSGWIEGLRRQPLLRTETAEGASPSIPDLGVRKSLVTAVHIKDKIAGFLVYGSNRKDKQWTERDGYLLREVERIIGDFLERKRQDDTRKERDERFRFLAQASTEGLLVLEQDRILDGNHVIGALLGLKPSEFTGKRIEDLAAESHREFIAEKIKLSDNHPFESVLMRRDGTGVPVEMVIRKGPVPDSPRSIAAVRDISERASQKETGRADLNKIKETLSASIQAMAQTISMHDPFTTGHVQGVAKLACAIGEHLKFDKEALEGLRIAGLLHDIGKIAIPVEILSKPGPLSETERMLVRDHPRIGHDILKDIDFPWPIANIVLQHHERMDGSGYPTGLSGEDILLEARILGAADRVEAILSPRSYRPAGDLKSAIDELTAGKGRLYDPAVAEAALAVIKAQGFSLKSK